MIVRRHFFRRLCVGLLASACTPAVLLAETTKSRKKNQQTPSPSPSPTPEASPTASPTDKAPEEKPENAKVRLWKASETPDLAIQLRFRPHGASAQEVLSPLAVEPGGYQFTEYAELPPGPVTVEVSAPGQTAVVLTLNLSAKSLSTFLVRSRGTTLTAEWIDDTPGGPDAPYEFVAYNLLPSNGGDIQIDMGNLLTAHLMSARSTVRLSGMKRAVYPVVASGVDGAGKNVHWTTDVDFRTCRCATLLIYPDAYGRIRPRVSTT